MDGFQLDALARSLTDRHSRRGLARFVGVLSFGGSMVLLGQRGSAAKKKNSSKKKKKKRKKCGGGCPKGFYCCSGEGFEDRCCPYLLGQCCAFGCCVMDPNMVCGPSESAPCLFVTGERGG